MTIVRWARHGQSEANVSRTFSHRVYDPDLTSLGQVQAAELGDRLAADPLPVSAVLSSPMRRARGTAAVVAARLGLGVAAVLEDLRELDVGSLDGRRDDEGWQVYHRVLEAWSAGDLAARFPDGEDGAELVARVRRAFVAAAAHDGGEGTCVLVVAHGGNVRAAVPALTGGPPPARDLVNCGWATFELSAQDGAVPRIDLLGW